MLVFKLEKLFWKRNQSFSEAMEEEFFESYNWDLDEHQRNDLNLFAFKFYSLIKCFSYCICIQKIGWGFKVFLYILYRLPSKYESFKVDNRALRFTLLVIWMSLDIEQFVFFTNVTENWIRKHTFYISLDKFNVNAYVSNSHSSQGPFNI